MSCDQNHLLSAYVDGELPSAEAASVTEHLATCPACSAEADELRALGRLMGMARNSDIGLPSDDVIDRLRDHVAQLVESTEYGLLRIARLFTGLAATVLIAGLWMLHVATNPSPQPQGVQFSVHAPTPSAPVQEVLAGIDPIDATEPSTREAVLEKLLGIEGGNIQVAGEDELP
jgi:anti-sigma factor RsiW